MLLFSLGVYERVAYRFIVIQSRRTLSNIEIPKDSIVNISNDARFKKHFDSGLLKIFFIEGAAENFHYWENEVLQRNSIGQIALRSEGFSKNDFALITDVDEVVHPDFIKLGTQKIQQNSYDIVNFHLSWHFGHFGHAKKHGTKDVRAFVSGKYLIETLDYRTNEVRNGAGQHAKECHLGSPPGDRCPDLAGWHCSWCFGNNTALYIKKMKSFSHSEMAKFANDRMIHSMRCEGKWIDGRKHGDEIKCSDPNQSGFLVSRV